MGTFSDGLEKPLEPIYCRHADVIAYIHALEIRISNLSAELANICKELEKTARWIEDHEEKANWFYGARPDLEDLVESKRWVGTSRRMILFVCGTIAGVVMAWNAVEILIREHAK
jgi:hypothetical protein